MGFRKDIPTIINSSDLVVMASLSERFQYSYDWINILCKVFISTKVSGCKDILSSKNF